jgi:AcrR family transcriptional regulator
MTREDIIKAAFRVWGRELYRSTSLTQLARDLGVTKTALYRYFPNKKALMEGMHVWFFDDYAAFIKADYERALEADDPVESMMIVARAMTRYYYRKMDTFLFALIEVYGLRDNRKMSEALVERGIDMRKLSYHKLMYSAEDAPYPGLMQLVLATLMFWVAYFYKDRIEVDMEDSKGLDDFCQMDPPSEEMAERLLALAEEKILNGLVFNKDRVDVLNYKELEERIASLVPGSFDDDGLYRAVAGAVSEAGPWKVSMDMVARRSGLSKSGLYSHFKNKQDMIRQFFMTEFKRIIASANAGISLAAAPEEQLYLAIIAIADYLRARPEILLTFDHIKFRNLDLGISEPLYFYQVFEGINAAPLGGKTSGGPRSGAETVDPQIRERIAQWILFLIINTLKRCPGEGQDYRSLFAAIKNASFRIVYRFIALGIHGLNGAFLKRGIDP